MGTSLGGHGLPPDAARIGAFFSPGAWIEGAALQQAHHVAGLPGMQAVALFPDLHPGKYGPTGMAALSERLHPQLIGNDIGCGMGLFALDLPVRKFRFDKAEPRLRNLMEHQPFDAREELAGAGLPVDLWPGALGEIGGGNHFCEVQAIADLVPGTELDRDRLYLLVHSGSRGLGASVFAGIQSAGLTDRIDADKEAGRDWLARHDQCVAWAELNRKLIAARAVAALGAAAELIVDTPHNLVRPLDGGFVHYKGAASVAPGLLAPLAGSRATASYLVKALDGVDASLGAISHGAGRKYDRGAMHGRVGRTRSDRDNLLRNRWGGKLICDDRNLVIEEAATAYKVAGKVLADLASFVLVEPVAELRPLLTYKKVLDEVDQPKAETWRRNRQKEARHGR